MPVVDLGNLGVEGGIQVLFRTCYIWRCLLDPQVEIEVLGRDQGFLANNGI